MGGLTYDDVIFKSVKNAITIQANRTGFTKAERGVIDDLTNLICSCKFTFYV